MMSIQRAWFAGILVATLLSMSSAFAASRAKTSAVFDGGEHPRRAMNARNEQSLPCGTVLSAEEALAQAAKLQNMSDDPIPAPEEPFYVPITGHIVRRSDGTGGLPIAQYEQAIANANLHYSSKQMVFYTLGPIDYLDSDAFYFDIDTIAEINQMRQTNLVPNSINIYFTPNLDYENGGLCGISAFTTSSVQSIAMRNSCTATSTNASTFSHEIGHYFDLFHTHETAFGDELVDGSNCGSAGDILCDTPADPRLSSSTVDSDLCVYTGSETDANGDPYDPDVTQLMSYSLKHCRDKFSHASLDRVVQTLVADRPELMTSPVAVDEAFAAAGRGAVSLSAPRPNPASQRTEMSFTLERSGHAEITIYDVRGSRVRTIVYGFYEAGEHVAGWDGRSDTGAQAAPGIYFARIVALEEQVARKIQIVR